MKLLNHSLKYLSVSIFFIVSIWSVIFYINMLDEIYDSIDDGLDNYRLLIIQKTEIDSTLLYKTSFDESNYAIQKIGRAEALAAKDLYIDTLLYMPFEKDLEPVRMLITVFAHHGDFYRLKVISSMVEEDDLIADLLWSIFWLYLVLIISIIVINNWVLRKLWRPFYTILAHLKAYRIDKQRKLPDTPTNTKEFIELKDAVNTLINHTIETYDIQKQFTENAAHELQTPLAIASGKLELLLEHNNLSDENAESIAQVLQIVERLTRLNKTLLLLSKIENKQFYDNQHISINKVVEQCLADLEDFTAFKQVKVSLETLAEPDVQMDATLANILIMNLIKNAIFHNVSSGEISIVISKDGIRIGNTGLNQPLDSDKVFNRFQKDSSQQQATGLGLAIVLSICKLYGFKVSYQYNNMHYFDVVFK